MFHDATQRDRDTRERVELAIRISELRDEAALLRSLVLLERDPVVVGLMHDLVRELEDQIDLLHVDPCAVLGRARV